MADLHLDPSLLPGTGLLRPLLAASLLLLALAACGSPPEEAVNAATGPVTPEPVATPERIRIAVFNVWELGLEKVEAEDHPQVVKAAAILQRVRPDVVLVNEIDHDVDGGTLERFRERYLAVSQAGQEPLTYAHAFYRPVNTGVPSGFDLDHDGEVDGPGDALGWGEYPGQYGMALLSRFPLDEAAARTFRTFPWQSLPGRVMPDGIDARPAWYGDEAARLPLSSKSHWDVPVVIGEERLHVLASHPTPPVFDGPEDRNGRRNFDEIRFWALYLEGGEGGRALVDDQGRRGGLDEQAVSDAEPGPPFVILGDLNADPHYEPVTYPGIHGEPVTAIGQLLEHPRVQDPAPTGSGAFSSRRGYPGPQDQVTSDFGLRADYVLPSENLQVLDAGVFWPAEGEPGAQWLAGVSADTREAAEQAGEEITPSASDHRLVWVDVAWPPG